MESLASSMVVIEGGKRVTNTVVNQFSEAAGIKFIKLIHENGFGGSSITVNGFQHVSIRVGDIQGRKTFVAKWSKDEENNDCNGNRSLSFDPDPVTQQLIALLPDSEFNRVKLARTYYHGASWRIADKDIEADIRSRADEFEKTLAKPVSKDEIIGSLSEEVESKDLENERLKREIALLKATTVQMTPLGHKEWDDYGITKTKFLEMKEAARTEIFNENPDLIKSIKEAYPKGWYGCDDYRNKISPLIKQRFKEKLDALNIANSVPA